MAGRVTPDRTIRNPQRQSVSPPLAFSTPLATVSWDISVAHTPTPHQLVMDRNMSATLDSADDSVHSTPRRYTRTHRQQDQVQSLADETSERTPDQMDTQSTQPKASKKTGGIDEGVLADLLAAVRQDRNPPKQEKHTQTELRLASKALRRLEHTTDPDLVQQLTTVTLMKNVH